MITVESKHWVCTRAVILLVDSFLSIWDGKFMGFNKKSKGQNGLKKKYFFIMKTEKSAVFAL